MRKRIKTGRIGGWRAAAAAFAVFWCFGAEAATSTGMPAAGGLLREVQTLERQGEIPTAIIKLRNAIRKSPDDPDLRLALGRMYLIQGSLEHAESTFRQASDKGAPRSEVLVWQTKVNLAKGDMLLVAKEAVIDESQPDEVRARLHALRGRALYARRKPEEAVAEIEAAQKLAPDHPDVLLALTARDLAQKDTGAAADRIETLLAIAPSDVEALIVKAGLQRQADDLVGAAESYGKAVKLRPTGANLRLQYASVLLAIDRTEAADSQIALVLQNVPDHPLARLMWARRLTERKYTKEAWDTLQPAMAQLGRHLPANLLATALTLELGHLEQALVHGDTALSLSPDNPVALRLMAERHLQAKHFADAVPLLEKLRQANPEDPAILARLATAYAATRRPNQAAAMFEQAAALDPDNQSLRLRLGMAKIVQGDSETAEGTLAGLTTDADTGPQATAALALLHQRQEEWDKAIAAARTYRDQTPDSPIPDLMLARIHRDMGDLEAAAEAFQAARSKDPAFLPAAFELAAIYRLKGQTEEEGAVYENLLQQDARNIRALLGQVSLAGRANDAAKALRLAKRASTSAPQSVPVATVLVNLHLQQNQKQEALAVAERLVASLPQSPQAYALLARVHFDLDDKQGGLAALRKTAALTPQAGAIHLRMAGYLARKNQRDEAREVLERAVEVAPNLLTAWGQLLADEKRRNGTEAALALARDAANRKGGSERLSDLLTGDILFSERRFDEALAAYQASRKAKPSAQLAVRIARTQTLAGAADDGLATLRSWLADHPNDASVRMSLADLLLKQDDSVAAIAEYETLIAANPRNVIALNNMAYLLGQTDPKRGLAVARKAWILAKNQPSIGDTYGWLLLRSGNVDRALPLLEKAYEGSEGQSPSTAYHFAEALSQAGQTERAAATLKPLLALDFAEAEEARALYDRLTAD